MGSLNSDVVVVLTKRWEQIVDVIVFTTKGDTNLHFFFALVCDFPFPRTPVVILTFLSASGKDLHVRFLVSPRSERFLITPSVVSLVQ